MPYTLSVDDAQRRLIATAIGKFTLEERIRGSHQILDLLGRGRITSVLADARRMGADNSHDEIREFCDFLRGLDLGGLERVAIVRSPHFPTQVETATALKEGGVESRVFVSYVDAEIWLNSPRTAPQSPRP